MMKNIEKMLKAGWRIFSLTVLLPAALAVVDVHATVLAGAPQNHDIIVQNDISIDPVRPLSRPLPPLRTKAQVGLFLPSPASVLAAASTAVQSGFFAAMRAANDRELGVTLFETADDLQDSLRQYQTAQASSQLIVGPVSRVSAAAVAKLSTVPTIVLAPADGDAAKSPMILSIGLSIEDEARQLASWAHESEAAGSAWIILTDSPWQRRAAHAFAMQLKKMGRQASLFELDVIAGVLNPESLIRLREQLHETPPRLAFFAVDLRQAIALREALGMQLPVYGTSQLNPHTASQWQNAESIPQLDGLRLLDLPSRLQEVTRQDVAPFANPDLERMQALGRDAYEVVKFILAGQRHFSFDGDTGRLDIEFGSGAAYFSRRLYAAIYENGRVMALPDPQ